MEGIGGGYERERESLNNNNKKRKDMHESGKAMLERFSPNISPRFLPFLYTPHAFTHALRNERQRGDETTKKIIKYKPPYISLPSAPPNNFYPLTKKVS